ncbi:O-methyltransferase [Enterococcus dongliensis]|uniref:tRNA 5-hydroxyuridine methyltransferase n=1 Tax=Enterococcus dongliensis TaxID=2559925 RepID=A0AAW8TH30_9ENTE|nr:O-methyltransferase [Enterococcus dongliensis]MDT2595523.1 O-methyltransferase [Enterococcus dongliensis]MDT2603261.1 O-methyltransferase [Enterococcus dongliensis]MDT2612766.1 O-methyltransferase [Enterococcus dongliensis]MDT2633624.1 O-methyltransferase [Enterococcus dongliensis]MDT2636002.1 O-methyltransferase [Enterococcus dongliensis]
MRNEMMYRPIINEDILHYLRTEQKSLTGALGELEELAHENGVPVIPHETVVFLQFLLRQKRPKTVLEIGTAIGFSASLMAETLGEDAKITTIDRFPVMIEKAKKNFEKLDLTEQITLLEGDAADLLSSLEGPYDFIFMDSAKAKYITFLPECLRLLADDGILMVDDIFQAGTILQPIEEIPRKNRAIHRKLNEFLAEITKSPELSSTLLPLGDGVALISKNK